MAASIGLNVRIKFFLHRHHYLVIGGILLLAIGLSIALYEKGDDWKVMIPIIGGAVWLTYIIEKQQLDEATLFKTLFLEFNQRYNGLNKQLNEILDTPGAYSAEDRLPDLDDYFNLCCEEYLYYRKGYIYPEVWRSWLKGMKTFYDVELIRDRWQIDLEAGSGYGFNVGKEMLELDRRTKKGGKIPPNAEG